MKRKSVSRAALALALAAIFLLAGCGAASGSSSVSAQPSAEPAVSSEPASASPEEAAAKEEAIPSLPEAVTEFYGEDIPQDRYYVQTVDEFLDALGSNRVIQLADGVYNLTEAANYGKSRTGSHAYTWYDSYDGYELRIRDVENLYLVGTDPETVSFITEPRYANVLAFEWCTGVRIFSVTAGHSPAPGYCTGGVLNINCCEDVFVYDSVLYGCGTMGISAYNSSRVTARSTVVKECSFGAIEAMECFDVRFVDGKVYLCGTKAGFSAYDIFSATSTNGFAVLNTEIYNNMAQTMLKSSGSLEVMMRGCDIHNNTFGEEFINDDGYGKPTPYQVGGIFHITGKSPVYADNSYTGNSLPGTNQLYYNYEDEWSSGFAVDAEGNKLSEPADLEAMEQKAFTDEFIVPEATDFEVPEYSPVQGDAVAVGETVYHVDNMDDFLAAIGDNTTIYIDTSLLDLSTASNYGGYGTHEYYHWDQAYDGPGLVISGVRNLSIIGQGKGKTTVQAIPRYADVLYFENCSGISVEDLTAGHRKEGTGYCSGDVLEFSNCRNVRISGCGLFGCGVNGIYADKCSDMSVENTEIYECVDLGAMLYNCSDVTFTGCDVHDCGNNSVYLDNCRNVNWEGELQNGMNSVS